MPAAGLTLLLGLLGLAACSSGEPSVGATGDPFDGAELWVRPDSQTAAAADEVEAMGRADDADLLRRVAGVPAGIWLTPEGYPPGEVGGVVTELVTPALEAGAVPVLVVYGVPERDCEGGFSAGGLTDETYVPWVQEVADAVAAVREDLGGDVAVVLEPDALATALVCGEPGDRVRQVGDAVQVLAEADVPTYVDAGHSDWIDPGAMAGLLQEVGAERVRGFAVNVSNYQTDDDEQAYAEAVAAAGGGEHWVIDRGRNGNGSTEEWCNPSGRALGERPAVPSDDGGLDAYLWVKPPAESDGTCNGGPPAGEIWNLQALELARNAGW